ncbi:MAG: homocysteine S-methyltransferase family protein, partial [Pseudomonadota bacterium]|nr:homocysteine S-methyltransferase family protein [Pseudomonadota bacterium]
IKDLPIEAVLFNCSQPETMTPALQIAAAQLDGRFRLGVYANAFDDIRKGHKSNEVVSALREDLIEDTSTYLEFCQHWIDLGARIIGGCCGIGPAHIKALCGLK